MKLPSFVSDERNNDRAPIHFRSLHASLEKTRNWLLMLATMCFLFYVCVLAGAILFTQRQENAGPQLIVFTILGLMLASFQPMFMIGYANRIQDFLKQSNFDNFCSLLGAQRRLWTLTGGCALLWCLFVVMGLVSQNIDKL